MAPGAQVHWLATAVTAQAANYYGTAITQSGHSEAQYDTANAQNPGFTYVDGGVHPMWSGGLDVRTCGPQAPVDADTTH